MPSEVRIAWVPWMVVVCGGCCCFVDGVWLLLCCLVMLVGFLKRSYCFQDNNGRGVWSFRDLGLGFCSEPLIFFEEKVYVEGWARCCCCTGEGWFGVVLW